MTSSYTSMCIKLCTVYCCSWYSVTLFTCLRLHRLFWSISCKQYFCSTHIVL